ncbi:MAG: biotin/lipoyl-containing protein, partial [Solirubrobacteraceae bacterium]
MSGEIQKLGMPKWGLSMTEGRLLEWLVDERTEVAVGDAVAEVETDKLNGAVESPVAGVLRRRVAA